MDFLPWRYSFWFRSPSHAHDGADSIRSVIPFPKTQSALCLLTDAPARVDSEQLEELGISLTDPDGD